MRHLARLNPLTTRGWGAIVFATGCFVVAPLLGVAELQYFGVFLVAITALSLVSLWLGVRLDHVERIVSPGIVARGATANVRVHARLTTLLPLVSIDWIDAPPRGVRVIDPRHPGDQHAVARGSLPAIASSLSRRGARGSAVTASYEVSARRRGVWDFGRLRVDLRDPLGLAKRSVQRSTPRASRAVPASASVPGAPPEGDVVVVPALIPLPATRVARGDTGGTSQTSTDLLGQGADNLIPRPYAAGDSMRRIHWRASAHRGELMVRQEERESTPEAFVVIDLHAHRWEGRDPRATAAPGAEHENAAFETALSVAASIVDRLSRDGFIVRPIAPDGTPIDSRPGDAGPGPDVSDTVDPIDVTARLLRSLATVHPATGLDSLPALAHTLGGERTGPVVLVTGALDDTEKTQIAPAAHHSTLPVVVSVTGDASSGGATDASARPAAPAPARGGWRTVVVRANGVGTEADLSEAWNALAGATRGAAVVR
ncbi:DUF58 domain-containing protein [uncultured Microbacterium sp.]|uniref:DUF58 domain-containing protein n=1 Tax=uncultured Microbacterium sp. TaxID=191216 RepID=UPI0025EB50E6|nr:DUF58 domain-containing protein [uncultured Microbacterium sp.]